MKFENLFVSCCSASFELVNDSIYFADETYDVSVSGKIILHQIKTNVFSLFNLTPDTDYLVAVGEDELKIHTPAVSVILHSNQFINSSNKVDDTLMLQTAINCLPVNGLLVIDEGDYHITSLFLKSDMTLEIKKGARLLGNTDVDAYPIAPGEVDDVNNKKVQFFSWEGNPFPTKPSVITAFYQNNINIVGEGVIDGQAQNSDFWKDVKHLTWGRPRMMFFNSCNNINVHGISVQNTACWTVHPYFSNNLGFYDIKISNPKDAPNTDGMDPECCKNIKIIGVYFSVGDDCVALKSGKIYIGKTYLTPCENALIRNCYMHEGHGAIVLGSEIGAGVKDVTIERCFFEHTDRGLRIKTRRGRGVASKIDDVVFKNIIMKDVLTPLVINMFYFCDPDGKTEYVYSKDKLPVDDRTPYMGRFVFDHITATGAECALGWFYGLPEMPIHSITISNSSFEVKKDAKEGMPAMMSYIDPQCKTGFYFNNVDEVIIDNVQAQGYVGEEFILNNVGSLKRL